MAPPHRLAVGLSDEGGVGGRCHPAGPLKLGICRSRRRTTAKRFSPMEPYHVPWIFALFFGKVLRNQRVPPPAMTDFVFLPQMPPSLPAQSRPSAARRAAPASCWSNPLLCRRRRWRPWLRPTSGADQRRSTQLGATGRTAGPRIDDTAVERCDCTAARPASIVQAAAMVDTNHRVGEPPAPPEMWPRVRLQAARAILQHRPRPAQPIGFFPVRQKPESRSSASSASPAAVSWVKTPYYWFGRGAGNHERQDQSADPPYGGLPSRAQRIAARDVCSAIS
jgi:hypothetical protein